MKAINTKSVNKIERTAEITMFLADARKQRVYNASEQRELVVKAQNGDVDARRKLISSNVLFIFSVCAKYANGNDILDLVSVATLGMNDAIEKYDASRDVAFISYAVRAMQDEIYHYLHEETPLIVNKNSVRLSKKVADIRENFYQFAERYPSNDEIVAILNEDGIVASEYQIENFNCNSFSEVIGDEDATNEECGDIAVATATANEYESVIESETKALIIERCLSSLTTTERFIIERVFGIRREYEMTDEDIAREIGVSSERVRQIKHNALVKMRKFGDVARAI